MSIKNEHGIDGMICVFVILHWRSNFQTLNCLSNVLGLRTGDELKVILVDNSSDFILPSNLEHHANRIVILCPGFNRGYSGGVNDGVRYALTLNPKYIVLLNSDAVIDTNSLDICLKQIDNDPAIGLLCPLILDHSGHRIWYAGGIINWSHMSSVQLQESHLEHVSESPLPVDTDYCTGACLFIRPEVFLKVGYFDEIFFAYWEDVDFSIRARQQGFRTVVSRSAIALHGVSQSSGGTMSELKHYYLSRNGLLFFYKHLRLSQFVFRLRFFLQKLGKRVVTHIYHGNWRISLALLSGLVAFLSGEKGKGRLGTMKNY